MNIQSRLFGLCLLSALTVWGKIHPLPQRATEASDFVDHQIEMARQQEPISRTQLFCELNFGNGTVKTLAISKIGQVGGGFAVSLLSPLLDDKPQNTSSPGSAGNDVNPPLQLQALRALPSAVPDPPLAKDHRVLLEDYSRELEIWRTWLKAKHDSLITLPPQPMPAVSAKVCKAVLREDFAARQYPDIKHHGNGRPQ